MVKNILIALGILLSIVLMFFISLSNGIRLGNFSYENVSIEGLYLKYDEKIIIDTQSVSVFSQYDPNKKLAQFKLKFSIESFFDNYFLRVYNFTLFEPYLKVTGDILLDPTKIDLQNISDLYFNNFSIQFSRNLSPVTAEKCFVEYKKESFYFTFDKPKYKSVDITSSKVSIVEYDYVDLQINSKQMLNSDVLELLSNYKVNIPVEQLSGTNETSVRVKIPFDMKKDLDIHSSISLENGKILLYGIPLYTQKLQLNLDNRYLYGEGKLFQNKNNPQNLLYDIDTNFQIDFQEEDVKGEFEVQNTQFETIQLAKTNGNFFLNFKNQFTADVELEKNSQLQVGQDFFDLEKFSTHYNNLDQTFSSDLKAKHKNYDLSLDIKDQFSLNSLESKGILKTSLKYDDILFEHDMIHYQTSFEDKFTLNFQGEDLKVRYQDNSILLNDIQGVYQNKKINGEAKRVHIQNNDPVASFGKIDFDIDENNKVHLQTPVMKVHAIDLPFEIKNIDLHLLKENLTFASTLDKSHTIQGELNVDSGAIDGKLKKDATELGFQGNIYTPKNLTVVNLGLQYKENKDNSYEIAIAKPKALQEYFDFLIMDEQSSINIKKQTNQDAFEVDMVNIDYDLFTRQEETNKEDSYNTNDIVANINWSTSSIYLGKYKIPFEKAIVNLSKDISHTNLKGKDNTNVNIKKDAHELIITSSNIGSAFVNSIFQKKYLDNGYFEFFLTNKKQNRYEGVVKINGVTFKELQFVDNLLLFVNTTPALINPLLAIPTFLRFGASGFKVDGYHAIEGGFQFIYYKEEQILELFNIKTVSNINNFHGNITLNLASDTINGNLNVVFLKDFARVLDNIPLLNKLLLSKDGNIALPVEISGTLEDTKFQIKGKDKLAP